jgi:hypothetical protein
MRCFEKEDTGVVATENAYRGTPEKIARLNKLRAAVHADWLVRYQHARKSRGWYYHLHLEVFEDEGGCWVGRIWDTVTEKLLHSADDSPDREKSKANLVAIARRTWSRNIPLVLILLLIFSGLRRLVPILIPVISPCARINSR